VASTFYIERMPRRFKAMQWTGDNLDEVHELDPWAIEWDPDTQSVYVDDLPARVNDWLVHQPGGVSVVSPELFAMEFVSADEAA